MSVVGMSLPAKADAETDELCGMCTDQMNYVVWAQMTLQPLNRPPAQELLAKYLHGNEWKFRHIFRGQTKPAFVRLEQWRSSFSNLSRCRAVTPTTNGRSSWELTE